MSHHISSACSFLPGDASEESLPGGIHFAQLCHAVGVAPQADHVLATCAPPWLLCQAISWGPNDRRLMPSTLPSLGSLCGWRDSAVEKGPSKQSSIFVAQDFCGSSPRMGFPGTSLSDGDSRQTLLLGFQSRSSEHNTNSTASASQSPMFHIVI